MIVKETSKGERTIRRIMDAAEKLFAQHGFLAASLRDIAAEAGIQQPGLYNHFPSKEALYAAVLERSMRPIEERISRLLDGPVSAADVQRLPVEMLHLSAEHPHMSALFYQAIQALHEGSPAGNAAKWMQRLFALGREVNRQVIPEDEETVLLQGIAMFNLCCGYFLAAPLIKEMTGVDAQSPEFLAKQQRLIERVMRTFLIG